MLHVYCIRSYWKFAQPPKFRMIIFDTLTGSSAFSIVEIILLRHWEKEREDESSGREWDRIKWRIEKTAYNRARETKNIRQKIYSICFSLRSFVCSLARLLLLHFFYCEWSVYNSKCMLSFCNQQYNGLQSENGFRVSILLYLYISFFF